jgi:lipid biosynthesis B12-binding/radical SAM protein
MSRVFILSANATIEPYPVYPLGMAVIASALAGRGHEVRQFDFLAAGCSEDSLQAELAEFAPDFVCFSLRNIDNVDSFCAEKSWYLAKARHLLDQVRKTTDAPVILGGAAFSIMPDEILDYLGADHGIVGEGEAAVCELVEALAGGIPSPRIIAGDRPPLSGDEMASPLLRQELVDFYLTRSGMLNLQTKRGCPFLCTYCTYPALEGNRFRPRDPRTVVDDLERAGRDHGVENFFFTDSVFNDAAGHYLEVVEELLRRDLSIRWSAFFRPQGLGREELALLKRSGLYALELGTDAACDTTLEGIRKGLSFAEVLEVNRACLAEEIPCAHFVMFGGPGENPSTVAEGLRNIEQLGPAVVFAFSGIRILAGTQLHARAIADGVIDAGTPLLKPVYYFSPQVDPEAMNAMILESFRNRRDRIFPPSAGLEKMAVMQRFGFRGLLWDKLFSFPRKGSES